MHLFQNVTRMQMHHSVITMKTRNSSGGALTQMITYRKNEYYS